MDVNIEKGIRLCGSLCEAGHGGFPIPSPRKYRAPQAALSLGDGDALHGQE